MGALNGHSFAAAVQVYCREPPDRHLLLRPDLGVPSWASWQPVHGGFLGEV